MGTRPSEATSPVDNHPELEAGPYEMTSSAPKAFDYATAKTVTISLDAESSFEEVISRSRLGERIKSEQLKEETLINRINPSPLESDCGHNEFSSETTANEGTNVFVRDATNIRKDEKIELHKVIFINNGLMYTHLDIISGSRYHRSPS